MLHGAVVVPFSSVLKKQLENICTCLMTVKYVFCGVIVKYIQNKQTEFHILLHSDKKIISIYA